MHWLYVESERFKSSSTPRTEVAVGSTASYRKFPATASVVANADCKPKHHQRGKADSQAAG